MCFVRSIRKKDNEMLRYQIPFHVLGRRIEEMCRTSLEIQFLISSSVS